MLSDLKPSDRSLAGTRSQATFAYEAIRGDILSGRHTPDQKLKIQDIATELSVSPGAVREALSRLVPEQLVVSWDQRGFAVAPLSISDLEELTDLRCEIEEIALRKSVENGDIDWEAGLLAANHRLASIPMVLDRGRMITNPDWIAAHSAFHTALIASCGNRRLLALHAQLYEQSERYRGLTADLKTTRSVADEHQQILDLALARQSDRLVEAMKSHLRKTTRLIVDAVRQQQAA